MKTTKIALFLSASVLAVPSFAQDAPDEIDTSSADEAKPIVVTGSSIKRVVPNGALPLQVITNEDLQREGISSPEQLVALLASNGNGADNLSSNVDVVEGAQRGTNGLSSANLRNQGPGATLVLLNGRRVASHGLSGSAVDVNQIPLAAVERVEVLKDGASAVYGTDAIGGVINFILKKDFTGVNVTGFVDKTQHGGGDIYRLSGTVGIGDLDNDGFNLMGAVTYTENKMLRGDQRSSFTTGFRNSEGLSPDTRGTPFATIFPAGAYAPLGITAAQILFPNAASTPLIPGTATRASGGINVLDLPGGAGCALGPNMAAYDSVLWGDATTEYACSWDSSQAAVLQQPLQTLTYVARGVLKLDDHEFTAEATGSFAEATKRFSNPQYSVNVGTTAPLPIFYPRNATTQVTYDRIFDALRVAFPSIPEANRGRLIPYRWRCIECGPREISTETDTGRFFLGAEGPLFDGWDYRFGGSYAFSKSGSTLGSGYHYRGITASGALDIAPGMVQALNTGIINPFLLPGESQSAAALSLIDSVSAEGVALYDGKFSVIQIDGSVSGSLFELPGGMAMAAVGVDIRKEMYNFAGDQRPLAERRFILNAPFDDQNVLPQVNRRIKAVYAELLLPLFSGFELTGAVRVDEYTGFGRTVNPKLSAKYSPIDEITFRGSYNTGFRVPTFNQIFAGRLVSPFSDPTLADPETCPDGRANGSVAGCASINPGIITGGNPNLGPEESTGFSLGMQIQPAPQFSASIDYWNIARSGTATTLTLDQLIINYSLFEDRFIRDGSGRVTLIDRSIINAGRTNAEGIDIALRFNQSLGGGTLSAGLDGTYLIEKTTQLRPDVAVSANEVGVYTPSGDLSLRWKHNAFIAFAQDDWSISLSQIFRTGNTNRRLGTIANGTLTRPDAVYDTANYVTYNLSASYQLLENLKLTAGVRNLFDTEPPFAITYSSALGAGGAWESRVADPRLRSFTLKAEVTF
jgi:iron complex outermembrane recepter protein